MKLSKVLLGSAVAVALTFGFAGCDWSLTSALQKSIGTDFFAYDDSSYDAGLGTWTVKNEENTSTTEYIRGGKLLLTKHSDIAGLVTLGSEEVASDGAGILGIMFDVSQNDDDTWNFGIVGLSNTNGAVFAPKYYVSFFYNISEDNMAGYNFGASKTESAYDSSITDSYEVPITKNTNGESVFKNLKSSNLVSGNVLSAVIDIDEDSESGDYTIKIYEPSALDKNNSKILDDATVLDTVTVTAATVGKEGAAQAYVGVYGNIYPADEDDVDDEGNQNPRIMYGTLEILDLTNDAIVAE